LLQNLQEEPLTVLPVCAACLIAAAVSVSIAVQPSVSLLPKWQAGDKLRFEMVRTRERSQKGGPARRSSAATDFEVEVLSASKTGFVLAWTWDETRLDDPELASNIVARKMVNLMNGFRMILDVDPDGAFRGVQNWAELKDKGARLIDTVSGELKKAGLDEATLAAVRGQVSAMFASREQIDQFATREPQLFFMVMGVEFDSAAPNEMDSELPNPFGGKPFPSRARIALKELDKETGLARVTFQQTVEPAEARRIMEQSLREMAKQVGKPAPDGPLFKDFAIEDRADFVIDTSTGWIRSLTHTRTSRVDAGFQQETIEITRKVETRK
jgi:hypothetical protein